MVPPRIGGIEEGGHDLVFAAGSIYWIKAQALQVLAALPVTAADFEPEMGQVDGTTAHALERLFGVVLAAAGQRIVQAAELDPSCADPVQP